MKKKEERILGTIITRRDFIRGTALGTLGLTLGLFDVDSLAIPPPVAQKKSDSAEPVKSRTVLIRDEKVLSDANVVDKKILADMLDKGIMGFAGTKDAASAWKKLFQYSDVVGVKINLMMTPTHDELIELIVENLLRIGIKDENIFVWDRDQIGVGKKEMFSRPRRFGFDKDNLNKVVKKCTALINVPGMKSHWLSGVALSIKNWAGAVNNARKYHTEDCCSSLGELCTIRQIMAKNRLIIMDALRPLFHGGPSVDPKYLWNYSGLIMGKDHVAVDTVALKIIQRQRSRYKKEEWLLSPPPFHVALADTRYKVGTSDLRLIDLVKLGWQRDALM
ncbi:MAG: hypothetical protein AMJ89_04790 [candidate division Zixibacteria bacterium SM23_73]|nr:MAG: hypothetical protein AMJ89_04790 [candidate division Zixibacteria bacterium SM23_73]